jgi:tricarballylate dehydrogenase
MTYDGLEDLRPILENVSDERAAITELPPYTPEDFMSDIQRITEGRCAKELTTILVDDAADTIRWLHKKGLRYRLIYDRQSFEVDGKRQFWGDSCWGRSAGAGGSSSSIQPPPRGAESRSATILQ